MPTTKDPAPEEAHRELYPDRLGVGATLIGCGGIGSALAPMIIRAGVKELTLWDPDVVEPVNLQMQNFLAKDVGKFKAKVTTVHARQINPRAKITSHNRRFTRHDPLDGIVFSAVDLMEEGRHVIFEAVEKQKDRVPLLIDGRFTRKGDFIDIYCIDTQSNKEMELYRNWLFSQSQMHHSPRSESMTAHVPLILAGLIGEALTAWAEGRRRPWKATHDALAQHTERYYA